MDFAVRLRHFQTPVLYWINFSLRGIASISVKQRQSASISVILATDVALQGANFPHENTPIFTFERTTTTKTQEIRSHAEAP